MKHTIKEENQRDSRINPGTKINYWIDYIIIDDENETLSVKTHDLSSYTSLMMRINTYFSALETEEISINFSYKEDEKELQVTFSYNNKIALEFLKAYAAFSEEVYKTAINYLFDKNLPENKTSQSKTLSTTIQPSVSQSCRLFSSDKTSSTPNTPPSEKSYSI